ncbi:permease [Acetonema longum]|uniref:Permease n=1 Tax=Acetonema longum DSM 6540 TaxID=1009370 RepID=F7NPU4_9FIRM|nr:permease [Acetonema longum]EGO61935.1 permease [Acetonema longum DSM 6540]
METGAKSNLGKLSILSILLIMSVLHPDIWFLEALPGNQTDFLQELTSIFLSIIIEAFPLVLLGVIISSFIHVFISDTTIHRLLPRNSMIGIVCGSLLGIFFPLCECGIIPIVRRLIQKGVPAYIAVPFMLSAPVINPLVGFSTYLAFNSSPSMLVYRFAGVFICANLIGILLYSSNVNSKILNPYTADPGCGCHQGCGCGHEHHHPGLLMRLREMLYHTCDEFFDMGRFLLIGSFLAAVIQITVPRTLLLSVGQEPVVSIWGMMGFAFILSVCSQADAFIAAPFAASFTPGAIASFLIYGPMLDIKNVIMMLNAFRVSYVMKLVLLITISVFLLSLLINCLPYFREVFGFV